MICMRKNDPPCEFLVKDNIDLGSKRLILFGTGKMSRIISMLISPKPAYYVDNNELKWGKSFCRRIIHNPETLKNESKDELVVLVASQFYGEICSQMEKMGFTENIHFFDGKELYKKAMQKTHIHIYKTLRDAWQVKDWRILFKNRAKKRKIYGPFLLFPPVIGNLSYFKRVALLYRFKKITRNVRCAHTQEQMLSFVNDLLRIPPEVEGCIVEAGAFKGGSTCKLSIAAQLTKRVLYVFDSFEGLPENDEAHERSILGHSIRGWFRRGKYYGGLDEVKNNIMKYGSIEPCRFIKGWFENTMPAFSERIVAAFIDVDLASSTRTCLKYLYPLLVPGGIIYSHDGDFPLVIEVFQDNDFWEKEVGSKKPHIEGLGKRKLIRIVKPAQFTREETKE